MTGTELATLCEELNGGASIGETLPLQFINLAKAMVERCRQEVVDGRDKPGHDKRGAVVVVIRQFR